jgi:diaminopimelate epimerase
LQIVKAHAFGNDFLLLDEAAAPVGIDRATLARATCNRHRGLGGDGLIFYRRTMPLVATMALLNADGSYSEVSGNGVRCLAAWLAHEADAPVGAFLTIETDAGPKDLALLERTVASWTFRAAMGRPEFLARVTLQVDGRPVDVITMRVGNPQCVVLGPVTEERLHNLAARLAVHPHFSAGTNVELATVEESNRVRILIWERGVGPTEASGTGACAAAVAAMQYGGAERDLLVISPGGAQRVEWVDDGLFLTGSAHMIAVCAWQAPIGS